VTNHTTNARIVNFICVVVAISSSIRVAPLSLTMTLVSVVLLFSLRPRRRQLVSRVSSLRSLRLRQCLSLLECPVRPANSYYTITLALQCLLKLVQLQAFYSKHLSISCTSVFLIHTHLV